ncbi:hypothetical protein OG689_24610 [Kitasatospora sp. NBC_00240]|uniref:hypothetical protein n=1 Tax=Kitasatospora sp. NBC_00240 TaxID=2903567 RepID=UPI00225A10E5|nr:hypothetical protein [Kitasatospora sp. NBC_00240]MCX5212427.1 hypothetical protein [Kitasatospora sp. NBC_00240]
MSSTTPAPERAPRDRAGEPARPAPGQGRLPDEAAAAAPRPGAAMRTLLAACAAAEAVSTPPGQHAPAGRTDPRRTAA